MGTKTSKWFEVTIRYYNPALSGYFATETIALQADNFTDAEKRIGDLYKGFALCEIQSISPASYEDVIFSDTFYPVMNWYLVQLEEDSQTLEDYYQYLKDSGCNCEYLQCCSYSNGSCSSTNNSNSSCSGSFSSSDSCVYKEDNKCNSNSCSNCSVVAVYNRSNPNYSPVQTIDYVNAPSCFRYGGPVWHKTYILVQGRDFTHVLQIVKEYMRESIFDYTIVSIEQTQLCDVILHDRCQL